MRVILSTFSSKSLKGSMEWEVWICVLSVSLSSYTPLTVWGFYVKCKVKMCVCVYVHTCIFCTTRILNISQPLHLVLKETVICSKTGGNQDYWTDWEIFYDLSPFWGIFKVDFDPTWFLSYVLTLQVTLCVICNVMVFKSSSTWTGESGTYSLRVGESFIQEVKFL